MKTRLWWSLGVAALSGASSAQGPAPQAAVSGIVFDSIAKRPLAKAVVQVIMVDSAGGALAATASTSVTDTSGQFRVAGLRRGSFLIGFQHSALVVLGLESPVRSFRIDSDTTLALDLAIPSGSTVRAQRCPASAADDGMVTGLILDAALGAPARDASVTLGWVELQSAKGQLRSVPQRVTARVGEDGTYVVCGLPGDAPLALVVSQPGYRDVFGEVTVARGDLLRRDVRLVDTLAVRVGSVLRGRVQHPDGTTLASGRVVLSALDVEASVENGEFFLPGVPAGTWAVEVRAIGYEPQMALVDVTEGAGTVLVTVGRPVQLLEAVNVIGRLSRNAKVLREIEERGRLSRGTQFFAGGPFMATAFLPSQVIRLARGSAQVLVAAPNRD
ncbi:MAG: carboxypeptidase-like regulatory domain-containing protein [Gemmatimonadota bacterium]